MVTRSAEGLLFVLLAVLALTLLPGSPALADRPVFRIPAACDLGQTCWIVNHVDADPEKDAARDFRCGNLTYESHNGTDFGLADLVAMEMGVDVLAAAPGEILRVRDGVEDKIVSPEEREALLAEDKGCGNGVFIDHGDGWQTIYCHMKKDSIAVKPGQKIKAGDRLGRIGLSGIAEFPHVHFGVFHDGLVIDPFTGGDNHAGCGAAGETLWDPALEIGYSPAVVYAAGFKAGVPDFEAVKIDAQGTDALPAATGALTFWVAMYGIAENDRILIEIRDPAGVIFAEREIVQEKNRARQFYFVGRKAGQGLAKGTYTGQVQIMRDAGNTPEVIAAQVRTLTVR